MRYSLLFIVSGMLFSGSSFAQSGEIVVDQELQQEVARESGMQEVVAQQMPAKKVLILSRTSNTTQQQPVTNVEATPLTESRAAQLRRARQDAEISTEQKIVEKLEQSRLEDEKRRSQVLFGSKKLEQTPVQQEIIAAPQAVQVMPVAQEKEDTSAEDMENMKADIMSSVRAELSEKEETKESTSQMYISGSIGTAEYQDAINVESNESMGIAVGSRIDDKYIVEGSFLYSNHYVDDASSGISRSFVYDELDQYNLIAAIKYAPKFGRISPQIGALVSYTRRKYAEVNYSNTYIGQNNLISSESTTDSFDVGISAGFDIQLGESFIVGAEYKYMSNLNTKSDSRFLDDYYSFNNVGAPLEEFDYYTFAIVGKILF